MDTLVLWASMILFALVAILHALRIFKQTPVRIGDINLPMWASILATIIPAFLSVGIYRILMK